MEVMQKWGGGACYETDAPGFNPPVNDRLSCPHIQFFWLLVFQRVECGKFWVVA